MASEPTRILREDVSQQAALKLLRKGFDPSQHPALFRRVWRQCFVDFHRSDRVRSHSSIDDSGGEDVLRKPRSSLPLDPRDIADANERQHIARTAVGALPKLMREVIELVDFQGLTLSEAARELKVEEPTARKRRHRAFAMLRVDLQGLV